MYRAWVEGVLGLRLERGQLRITPVIPAGWDRIKIRYKVGQALYEILIENPDHVEQGVARVELDGRSIEGTIALDREPVKHTVRVVMGK